MALFVMAIIIILNIVLLLAVMRLGTQGEHHSEFAADQSAAVMALHNRLGISASAPQAVAEASHTEETTDDSAEDDDTDAPADESDSE